MLNKKNRLTSKFQFNVARKYGQYYEGSLMHIYVLKPQNFSGETKVGFVVSNKFHKRAAKRNAVRRLFREIVRLNIDKLGKSNWIVIHPKFDSLNKTYEEISTDFNKILQKISISN
jgi:ribonuclease P protein component